MVWEGKDVIRQGVSFFSFLLISSWYPSLPPIYTPLTSAES